jgi:hypothetical protein
MLAVLTPLLSLLGLEAAEITGTLKRRAITWGAIGALGVVAISFVLIAINAALSNALGPVVAPLIIAIVALVAAIAVFLVMHIIELNEAKRAAEKKRSTEVTALITTAALTAIPMLLRSSLIRDIGIPAGAALASSLWFHGEGDDRRKRR